MTAINDRSGLLNNQINTQTPDNNTQVNTESQTSYVKSSSSSPAKALDKYQPTAALSTYAAMAAQPHKSSAADTYTLNPAADDFADNLIGKYDAETIAIWKAISTILASFTIQMIATIVKNANDQYNTDIPDNTNTDNDVDATTPTSKYSEYSGILYEADNSIIDTELFDENGANFADTIQGEVGDCYFLSALSGVATQDPEILERNIKAYTDPVTGEQLFDVTFYELDDEGEVRPRTVTVNDQFLRNENGWELYAQSNDFDENNKYEIWVAVYEKAYGVFLSESGSADEGYVRLEGEDVNGDGVGDGGYVHDAYFAITGKVQNWDVPENMDTDELADILGRADIRGGDCIALVSNNTGRGDVEDIAPGIPGGHAYTVLGTYEDPDTGELMVTLRNPWGMYEPGVSYVDGEEVHGSNFDGTNDGIFSIPIADVQKYFANVFYPEESNCDVASSQAAHNPPRA
ncbi:MAG: hypothetical protein JW841_02215 [Deltaproteobacteria bacterium]|nr:hypothetical protein [Deltaproteobacteria bacterium]